MEPSCFQGDHTVCAIPNLCITVNLNVAPPAPAHRKRTRALAFVVGLELLQKQVCLPVAQHEGEEGEDEGVEDADDGQDVRPAHRTVPQGVLAGLGPAHVPDGLGVPAVGEDHAAQHEAQS